MEGDNDHEAALNQRQAAQAEKKEPRVRFYWIDWVRTVAVHLVAYVHTIGVAEELRRHWWPNENTTDPDLRADVDEKDDGARRLLLQIGIPVFFYISGFSVTFFNIEKKHFGHYIKDKFMRLIIPLVVGFFLFLIPRCYIDQNYSQYGWPDQHPEYNFWKYFVKIFPLGAIKRISWLWFLPALFVDCLIAYPLLKWSKRRYA